MSVKNRLIQLIEGLNISVREFEKSINASNGYVNSISKSIGVDKINVIVEKYPTLNIDWLMTGRGEMLINSHYSTENLDDKIAQEIEGKYERKNMEDNRYGESGMVIYVSGKFDKLSKELPGFLEVVKSEAEKRGLKLN